MHTTEKERTQGIEVKERSIEEKIADAVACCAAVAKLYRKYGGSFRAIPTNQQPKTRLAFRGPRNTMKRRLKLEKPIRVPRYLFCQHCNQPFLGAANYRCQCKATTQNKRRAG